MELTLAERSREWAKYAAAFPTHQWHSFLNTHPLAVKPADHDRHHAPKRTPWGGIEMEWQLDNSEIIKRWVPWEWEHTTCLCPMATYKKGDHTRCSTCGKMARHRLYVCRGCKKKQCLDFTWPGQTLKDVTLCYFCMVEKFGTLEGAVPPKWSAREVGEFSDESLISLDFDDLEL